MLQSTTKVTMLTPQERGQSNPYMPSRINAGDTKTGGTLTMKKP